MEYRISAREGSEERCEDTGGEREGNFTAEED